MENQKKIFEAAEKGEARAAYDKVGALAGLNSEADIQACFADKDKLAHIQTNSERADGAGLSGVPAFYINGDAYEGKQDAETLTKLILDMNEKGLSKLPTSLPKKIETCPSRLRTIAETLEVDLLSRIKFAGARGVYMVGAVSIRPAAIYSLCNILKFRCAAI